MNKQKSTRRILAIAMCIFLLFPMVLINGIHSKAMALPAKASLTVGGTTTLYESFDEAIAAATGDAVITMLDDDTYTGSTIYIGSGYDLTSLTLRADTESTLNIGVQAFMIFNGGTFTIDSPNLTIMGSQYPLDLRGGTFNMIAGSLLDSGYSAAHVDSGTVNITGGTIQSNGSCFSTSSTSATGTLNLSGGTLRTTSQSEGASVIGFSYGEYDIYLSGGKNLQLLNDNGGVGYIGVNSKVRLHGQKNDDYFTGAVGVFNYGIVESEPLNPGEVAIYDISAEVTYSYYAYDPYDTYMLKLDGENLIVENSYEVTFEVPGLDESLNPLRIISGGKIEEPADPSREGYVFGGWFADEDLTDPWDFENDVVTNGMTLYASWTEATTEAPTTEAPTTEAPTTAPEASTTAPVTTIAPTTVAVINDNNAKTGDAMNLIMLFTFLLLASGGVTVTLIRKKSK